MDLGRILSGGQLVEKLFVLISDSLPAVNGADAVRSASAEVFSQFQLAFDQPNLGGQIIGIAKEQSIFSSTSALNGFSCASMQLPNPNAFSSAGLVPPIMWP